ncbi:hypothetical protein ATANTOWER_018531 [Ataeniobius toweri]|uniref:Uncharacterized protein n=1 Tax=Ataeniobius toweri TaxID=208326 RepID=A0ABU7AQY3_9TELE|nr:hypothetical protein [Ataeniobius toweri]
MQRTQICSFQENFTDYLRSWLRSGSKAPQAYLQTNLAHPPRCSPSKKDPPGATFISRASKTGLPGPIYSPHTPWSFHPTSPFLADLQVFNFKDNPGQPIEAIPHPAAKDLATCRTSQDPRHHTGLDPASKPPLYTETKPKSLNPTPNHRAYSAPSMLPNPSHYSFRPTHWARDAGEAPLSQHRGSHPTWTQNRPQATLEPSPEPATPARNGSRPDKKAHRSKLNPASVLASTAPPIIYQ